MNKLKEGLRKGCKLSMCSAAVAAFVALVLAVRGIVDVFGLSEAAEIADEICGITYNVMISAAMVILLVMFGKMLKYNTPFNDHSLWLLIAASVVVMLSGLLAPLARTVALVVLGGEISFSFIDSNVFFLCVMMMFVSRIIIYGTKLQQESDETL